MYESNVKPTLLSGEADHALLVGKRVDPCEVCGRKAELENVKGYLFQMCPHCAYKTRMHSNESHGNY
jgi:hypothetical protein